MRKASGVGALASRRRALGDAFSFQFTKQLGNHADNSAFQGIGRLTIGFDVGESPFDTMCLAEFNVECAALALAAKTLWFAGNGHINFATLRK
jgi:hypothetical protein